MGRPQNKKRVPFSIDPYPPTIRFLISFFPPTLLSEIGTFLKKIAVKVHIKLLLITYPWILGPCTRASNKSLATKFILTFILTFIFSRLSRSLFKEGEGESNIPNFVASQFSALITRIPTQSRFWSTFLFSNNPKNPFCLE